VASGGRAGAEEALAISGIALAGGDTLGARLASTVASVAESEKSESSWFGGFVLVVCSVRVLRDATWLGSLHEGYEEPRRRIGSWSFVEV